MKFLILFSSVCVFLFSSHISASDDDEDYFPQYHKRASSSNQYAPDSDDEDNRPLKHHIAAPSYTQSASETLSLIHISEPTRPY